ncbi:PLASMODESMATA CALLOSE-BINDING PROTEIN 2-like [Olea europaea subsp. europaea]|uniref:PLASMODESMATA CALLOSE-BINDING PROTEIN 2-like n=1 Tax=Olea europaea subsp. europaea TaxID=158383 RepID=A0A8S0UUU9_OLEEU|nr:PLASMODESMATA CALLOSE-BINDING PROTEIN 2-like [Olea europaea subsp. europaea]
MYSNLLVGATASTWCICKEGVSEAVLQKTLDYACGNGADCTATRQNGACFIPNTVKAHCNYAVNSYFQRKAQAASACDFSGTARVVTSDPSAAGCVYPTSTSSTTSTPVAMPSVAPTTATPSTTPTSNSGSPLGTTPSGTATPNGGSPVVTTPSTTTTTGSTTLNGTSPLVTTPSIGVLGGTNSSLGPSGSDINTDMNDGGISLQNIRPYSFFTMIIASFAGFLFLWA